MHYFVLANLATSSIRVKQYFKLCSMPPYLQGYLTHGLSQTSCLAGCDRVVAELMGTVNLHSTNISDPVVSLGASTGQMCVPVQNITNHHTEYFPLHSRNKCSAFSDLNHYTDGG